MTQLATEEFMKLSREIEQFHSVFYKIWEIGRPQFSESIDTAAVEFSKDGNVLAFLLNKDFWDPLDTYSKTFVICHECCHILLNHGGRCLQENPDLENIAMDLAVNEMLLRSFGFNKENINRHEKLLWIDSFFDDECIGNLTNKGLLRDGKVKKNASYEYYYKLISEGMNDQKVNLDISKILEDVHNFDDKAFQDVLQHVADSLSDEALESVKSILEELDDEPNDTSKTRGDTPLGAWIRFMPKKIKENRKWESVIVDWVKKRIKKNFKQTEQWVRLNRRFVIIDRYMDDMCLPSEMEEEVLVSEKDKLDVWFFIDASGSCLGHAERFFRSAQSVPKDKFNVKLFSFDTKIYELDLKKPKIKGGGGTRFSMIGNRVKEFVKKHPEKELPHCWILTDGYGGNIDCINPKRWVWFMTRDNTTSYIPKECLIYKLSDFT